MSNYASVIIRRVAVQVIFLGLVSCCNNSAIGTGFFIAKRDMLDDFSGGATIFKSIPEKCRCIKHDPAVTKRITTQFRTTESFYNYVASKVDLEASLIGKFALSMTLSMSSGSISGSSLQTSGQSIDIYALTEITSFPKDCQNDLSFSTSFSEDLNRLPSTQIDDPHIQKNWLPYDSFLRKYGSHIVKEIHHGSRIQGFTFAKQSKKYSETDFKIRGCVNFNYYTAQFQACAGYTDAQKQAASEWSMSDVILIRGGTHQTRTQLQTARTAVLIEKFLNEAETSPGNVLYKWVSIWEVLKERPNGNSGDVARALNLEQYYKGFLDFGCTFVTKNNVKLRWMEAVGKPTLPSYNCLIQSKGCKDNGSCRDSRGGCYCKGNKCVGSKTVKDQNSKIKTERYMQTDQSGSPHDGINDSCNYDDVLVYCKCDTSWGGNAREIWPNPSYPSYPTSLSNELTSAFTLFQLSIFQLLFVIINI